MIQRGATIDETIGTGVTSNSAWNIERGAAWNMPALVGTVKSDKEVTVKLQQSHDGVVVHFEETISDVPGNSTMAANTIAGYRFARVAPYVRLSVSNASGADAAILAYIYGSN